MDNRLIYFGRQSYERHMQPWLTELLCCPECDGELVHRGDTLDCDCGQSYPVIDDIPVFVASGPDQSAETEPTDTSAEPPRIAAVSRLVEQYQRELNLDVGCGTGRNLGLFDGRYVGCDTDFAALLAAKERVPEKLDAVFVCCDGRKLPFKRDRFGFVLSSEVIEHVQPAARSAFVAELRRVLNHDGHAVVSAPTRTVVGDAVSTVARYVGVFEEESDDDHPRTTVTELRQLGFQLHGCLDAPAQQTLEQQGLEWLASLYDSLVWQIPRLANHCVGVIDGTTTAVRQRNYSRSS